MASRQIRGLVAVYGALLVPAALLAQSEVRGRLVDSTGAPILGAVVTLPAVGFQVRADSNGRFAVAGQRGSSLRLLFSAPDYRTDSATVLLGRSPVVREFTLISNDAPLPEVNPSDRVVAGLVTDETGTPLSSAMKRWPKFTWTLAYESGVPVSSVTSPATTRSDGFTSGSGASLDISVNSRTTGLRPSRTLAESVR